MIDPFLILDWIIAVIMMPVLIGAAYLVYVGIALLMVDSHLAGVPHRLSGCSPEEIEQDLRQPTLTYRCTQCGKAWP